MTAVAEHHLRALLVPLEAALGLVVALCLAVVKRCGITIVVELLFLAHARRVIIQTGKFGVAGLVVLIDALWL